VARNRKRAKERRTRRPSPVIGPDTRLNGDDGAQDPLAHAAPDAELAEAQLALGRPEFAEETPEEHERNEAELEAEAEADGDLYDGELEEDGNGDGGGGGRQLDVAGLGGGGGGEHAAHPAAPRANLFMRMVGFIQGSWRELQRVQWPDRRQVMQATGVVIGFVIVAGVFLGVADVLASHVMNVVLEGHW
jgi:preprotein translocase subunit SecE